MASQKKGKFLELTIQGRVPSAKNSRRIFRVRGRTISLKSKAYERFSSEAAIQVREQLLKEHPDYQLPMAPSYLVFIEFYMKGKGATDGDNMESAIFDLLQDTGVIEDDKHILQCVWTKQLGAEEYKTIITILCDE